MTDLITPAAAVPEPITPQEPPSTPTLPPESGTTPENQQEEPKYVTLESLEKFGDTLVKRMSQSSRDREKAIKTEVGSLRKSLEAAGITPTAEQEAKLRATVEAKLDEEPAEPEHAPASAAPIVPEQADQFLTKQISVVFGKVGTTVTKADPEFAKLQKAIDDGYNDPNGLTNILLTAHEVATAKAARLQNQSQTAAARVVGGGHQSGGQVQQAGNAHDAWEQAYKK
jgi:hypothetical protein